MMLYILLDNLSRSYTLFLYDLFALQDGCDVAIVKGYLGLHPIDDKRFQKL